MFDKIRPVYFFSAFVIGLVFCYYFQGAPRIVVKFPTPFNVSDTVYVDKTDSCYKYTAEEVSCPSDPSKVHPQPLNL